MQQQIVLTNLRQTYLSFHNEITHFNPLLGLLNFPSSWCPPNLDGKKFTFISVTNQRIYKHGPELVSQTDKVFGGLIEASLWEQCQDPLSLRHNQCRQSTKTTCSGRDMLEESIEWQVCSIKWVWLGFSQMIDMFVQSRNQHIEQMSMTKL